MILMVLLLAPTVPSEPRPWKIARTSPSPAPPSNTKEGSTGRERWVTSSSMPTVKEWAGAEAAAPPAGWAARWAARWSNTALAIAGVNSLEASP